jgi:threonine aldolase
LPVVYTEQVADVARRHGLRLHLDGARIFNAAIAQGVDAGALAAPAHSVTFCLSKALCAPVGSVLCGDEAFIARARRLRKQLGGGMRQVGVLAAAGIVALESMVNRLAEDHRRAGRLAEGLAQLQGVVVDCVPPPTNMVYLTLAPEAPLDSQGVVSALAKDGIKLHPVGPRRIRLVVHYWIDDEAIDRVLGAFQSALRKY